MADVASTETQEIPIKDTKIVHLPTRDADWRRKVASNAAKHIQNVRKRIRIGPAFTENDVAPAAFQPVPKSKELDQVGAERVGVAPEFPLSGADIGHQLDTLGVAMGGEGPSTFIRTSRGHKVTRFVRERARRLAGKKKDIQLEEAV